jgi:hypothetical protein
MFCGFRTSCAEGKHVIKHIQVIHRLSKGVWRMGTCVAGLGSVLEAEVS